MLTSCGQFRIFTTRSLGGGGEGVVYEGEQVSTGALMAVKVLRRAVVDPLPAEASALGRIPSHPSIIPPPVCTHRPCGARVLSALVFPRYLCDLHSCAEADGPMPEPVVRHVLQQLLAALAHLHAHGYSHNDVKLENIFVAKEGPGGMLTVVLGDFGLARPTLVQRGTVLGTETFFAPEVHCLRGCSPASVVYNAAAADVWAAGVVGLMCLTQAGVGFDGVGTYYDVSGASASCQSFFTALLIADPARRPSAATMLKHEWLADAPAQE